MRLMVLGAFLTYRCDRAVPAFVVLMRLMALGAFQLRFIRQVITISAASLNAPYGARCYLTHVQRPPSRAGCGVLMRRLALGAF